MPECELDFLEDVFQRHQEREREKPPRKKPSKKVVGQQPALEIGTAQVTVEKQPPREVFAAGQGRPSWPEDKQQLGIQAVDADQVMREEAAMEAGRRTHLLVHPTNIAICQKVNKVNCPLEQHFPTMPPEMITQIREMSTLKKPTQSVLQLPLGDKFLYGTSKPDLLQTAKGTGKRAVALAEKYHQWLKDCPPLAQAMNMVGGFYFAEVGIVVKDRGNNVRLHINPDGTVIGNTGKTATIFSIKSGKTPSKKEEWELMALAGFYLPTIAEYDASGRPCLPYRGNEPYPFQSFPIGKTTLGKMLGRPSIPPPREVTFVEARLGEENPFHGVTIQTFSRHDARTALKEILKT